MVNMGEKSNAHATLDDEPETNSPLQNVEVRNRAVASKKKKKKKKKRESILKN